MKITNGILTLSLLSCFIFPVASNAKSSDPIWFIDHAFIKPGKSLEVAYQFPSNEQLINCYSEMTPDFHLDSVEWTYKGTTYKTQIGWGGHTLPFNLAREDAPQTPEWNAKEQYPIADAAGTLKFTNTSKEDVNINCAYVMGPDPYATQ